MAPLSDAAWAKENLARAKQTLPNGYCGLPLQQSCPHPNACLTCDHFLTTAEFLPEQLERTERLIAGAQADGRHRIAEMNEPVRLNLIRIIDGLEALEPHAAVADRSRSLAAAAARRRSAALERAQTALHDLDARGETISFQSVARAAAVSRQWLYQQPELRSAIERLRARGRQTPAQPARERASDASLRQRIQTLLEENRRLRAENRELRTELALAYGQQRDAAAGSLEPR